MIIGSYQLHLYCDYPDDSYEHRGVSGAGFMEVSCEETRTKAMQHARKIGWKFRGEVCLCPCSKKGRKIPESNNTA